MSAKLSAIDLFAGGGGLATGLKLAGFSIRAGVELDPTAVNVFRRNHRSTHVFEGDIRKVKSTDLARAAGERLALVAGCAPCQGFCSLTSKWSREDPRNGLVLEMARVVEDLLPEAVIMENVPGLAERGRTILDQFCRRLRRTGYYPLHGIVQLADFGLPQRRRRFVMLAGRGFAIPLPTPTHAAPWVSSNKGLKPWVTVRDVLSGRKAPVRLSSAMQNGSPETFDWHVVRDLRPATRARLKAAVPGGAWMNVPEHLRPRCHRGTYRGFTNVYGRMRWNYPAPTITSGCTSPCKGRFGHPDRRRTTISVREAALLQGFPTDYRFATNEMDAVCDIIGNAVPPIFAEVLGRQVRSALQAHRAALR